MKLTVNVTEAIVTVKLSQRNLLALLSKLKRESSARTIFKEIDGWTLVVKAEPDIEHYGPTKPGLMHPKDESFIGSYGE